MKDEIIKYNNNLSNEFINISNLLLELLVNYLPEAEFKIWHKHPVWFLDGNPIVGYSLEKKGLRLMFWSGADFEESKLKNRTGKFKDASIYFNSLDEIDEKEVKRWIEKSKIIQWDYKNIVKRKGELIKI